MTWVRDRNYKTAQGIGQLADTWTIREIMMESFKEGPLDIQTEAKGRSKAGGKGSEKSPFPTVHAKRKSRFSSIDKLTRPEESTSPSGSTTGTDLSISPAMSLGILPQLVQREHRQTWHRPVPLLLSSQGCLKDSRFRGCSWIQGLPEPLSRDVGYP